MEGKKEELRCLLWACMSKRKKKKKRVIDGFHLGMQRWI